MQATVAQRSAAGGAGGAGVAVAALQAAGRRAAAQHQTQGLMAQQQQPQMVRQGPAAAAAVGAEAGEEVGYAAHVQQLQHQAMKHHLSQQQRAVLAVTLVVLAEAGAGGVAVGVHGVAAGPQTVELRLLGLMCAWCGGPSLPQQQLMVVVVPRRQQQLMLMLPLVPGAVLQMDRTLMAMQEAPRPVVVVLVGLGGMATAGPPTTHQLVVVLRVLGVDLGCMQLQPAWQGWPLPEES